MISRRGFLAGAVTLLAAPLATEAQQTGKVYHVGLVSVAVAPGGRTVLWRAFLDAMRELNYVEGRNLVVRQAAAAGKREALPGLLADLVKQPLDIIVTSSASETLAAKRATSTVPIVMTAVFDPVTEGLVESLARPGGNVTGLTILVPGLSQKYVELLKEVVPATRRFTVVTGRAWAFPQIREELLSAARQVGVTLSFAEGNGPDELATVLARARKDDSGAIIAPLDGRTYLHRRALAQLALQHRLPGGSALAISSALAAALAIGMIVTLRTQLGLRMLRFLTLIPVVLSLTAVLRNAADTQQNLIPPGAVISPAEALIRPAQRAPRRPSREQLAGASARRRIGAHHRIGALQRRLQPGAVEPGGSAGRGYA